MRKIVKLIFRLDFKVNLDFLDKRAPAFQALLDSKENFWSNIAETIDAHSIKGIHRTQKASCEITMEPTTVNGILEIPEGIDFNKILDDEYFREFDRIVQKFSTAYNLDKMFRAGIRVYSLENYGERVENYLEKFRSVFNRPFLEHFNEDIGSIENAGIHLDGITKEDLNYHVNFGNCQRGNLARFFTSAFVNKEMLENMEKNHTFTDFDLFETDFSFKGLSLKRWTKDKWPVIDRFMVNLKNQLLSES